MRNILIVVDMQNDFIDGSLGTKEAQGIVISVAEKIRNFEGDIYGTLDTHEEDYLSTLYSDETETSFENMKNPYETEQYKKMWTAMKNFRTKISDILKENGIDAVLYVSQTDVCDKEESSNNHNNGAAYINNFGPVAGLPDMMIPMGMSKTDESNGYNHALPLGMSMFSSYGNEAALMQIAYSYEQ